MSKTTFFIFLFLSIVLLLAAGLGYFSSSLCISDGGCQTTGVNYTSVLFWAGAVLLSCDLIFYYLGKRSK
jgi:hypothetical protein